MAWYDEEEDPTLFGGNGAGGGMLGAMQGQPQQEQLQWGNTVPQASVFMGNSLGSPFDEGNQKAETRNSVWDQIKSNPENALLIAGLSMLANNNGRRTFGQLLGQAGIDTLGGMASASEKQAVLKRQKEADEALKQQRMMQNALAYSKLGMEQQKMQQEQDGWNQLRSLMGGSPSTAGTGFSGAPSSPEQGTGDPSAPIWQRYNNPMNLKDTSGGWRQFGSFDEAWPAYKNQLELYAKRGLTTPAQIIGEWAPASAGNNTGEYIQNVKNWTGLDPNTPINTNDPSQMSRLMAGMARQESGKQWDPSQIQAALAGNRTGAYGGGYTPQQNAGTIPMAAAFIQGPAGAAARQLLSLQGNVSQRDLQNSLAQANLDMSRVRLQMEADKNQREAEKRQEDAAKNAKAEADKQQKQADRAAQQRTYGNVVLDDIGRVRQMANDYWAIPNTGAARNLTSWIPGTAAYDMNEALNSIRSNVSFDRLQQMRDSSPTGGALGSVSDFENKMLQSALGSLDPSQSKEQFLRNLERVESIYGDIVHGVGNWKRDDKGNIVPVVTSAKNASPQGGSSSQRLRYNPQTGRLE